MLRSSIIGFILLFLRPVATDKGGSPGGDPVVSVTLTMTSGTTVTIPTTGTTTQSSMQPAISSSAPLITIPTLSNATTCMPMTFTWQVTPSTFNTTNIDVRLTITNDGVQQLALSQLNTGRGQDFPSNSTTRCVTNSTTLSSGFYNWTAVTVPAGWYILDISPSSDSFHSMRGLFAHSDKFFVMAGSNASCVRFSNSTSPAQSNSHFTSGALAGTIAGSVVGAAALIGAFILPRLWRRGVPGHRAWKEKRGLYQVF